MHNHCSSHYLDNSETMRRPKNYNMPKNDFMVAAGCMRPGSLFHATKTAENTRKIIGFGMHSQSKPGQIPKRIYLCRLLGTFVVLLSCFTMWQHLNLKKYHHVRQLRTPESNLRLPPLLKPHVIDIINDKYKYGRPSDILGENGLLIHMADSMGDWGMDVWSNKPGMFAGSAKHLSCSIINVHNPHVFPQGNPYFETHETHSPVGYILEDANTPLQCVSRTDGGTSESSMEDSEWSGCACVGKNPHKVPKARCMMPSTQLKEMMEKSSTGKYAKTTYNEVVISKQYWKETSPSGQAILAFFYIKGSPAREEVVASHKNYLRYTHQTSSQTPLLEYDATNKQQPFIEVENE